jgi:hypothetical protein
MTIITIGRQNRSLIQIEALKKQENVRVLGF